MKEPNRIPTHPGEVIKEELESRGITQKQFSQLLGLPYTQVNEILNGKRQVSADFALMTEASLGINPLLLINMQNRYDMGLSKQKTKLLDKLNDIHKACAALW